MKVDISFDSVNNLQVKAKDSEVGIVTTISFESPGPPIGVARLLTLMRQKAPIICTFSSNQAVFDLELLEVTEKVSK